MTFPPVFNPKATRAVSHVFDLPYECVQDTEDLRTLTQVLQHNLSAESQRLQRLLPEPPEDYYWELSIETSEDVVHNIVNYRAVYRLEKIK